ncbi:hypothetical protein ES676_03205 [Bizionia saleffrena]|uniref:Lipoprotein n=1 Tax=Bizionia saleffrena TaxID=291189 RepID=A0A8H2LE49_9FLAO|nr:hypothetical protein [Bizionia saleffrena]TYB77314.1 hypothetical protein ES676_03205 [Bizionia saleffrena]
MNSTFKIFLFSAVLSLTFACNNDDDDGTDTINPPNEDVCNYQGLTFYTTSNGTETLIPGAELTAQYVTGGSNGPEIEIYKTTNPGFFNFTTIAVNEGATGTGTINLDGNTYANLAITCQRGVTGTTGAVVGDEFRFDIVGNGLEIELCVIVTDLTLGYIDADGDGCGSQTISYGFGVLNNIDTDDTDSSICN